MAIEAASEVVRELLAAPCELSLADLVNRSGALRCVRALIAEVAWRCRPPVDVTPFHLRFDVATASTSVGCCVAVHPDGASVLVNRADGAACATHEATVTVRTDLAELWWAVFGGCDATAVGRIADVRGATGDVAAYRRCFPVDTDLAALAVRYGSDKWGFHWYTPHYERHLRPLRDRRVAILEIGVGGYDDEAVGGGSLKMWKRYFPFGLIYGLDLYDKPHLAEPRIKVFTGHQADAEALAAVVARTGPLDLIIDDGSHINSDVLASFRYLYPQVRAGGLYVIEDLQTSYWPGYGGDGVRLDNPATTVGFLKSLVDGLNHEEFLSEDGYQPSFTDRNVVGVYFYHNLAVIEKGVNAEGTVPDYVPRVCQAYTRRTT